MLPRCPDCRGPVRAGYDRCRDCRRRAAHARSDRRRNAVRLDCRHCGKPGKGQRSRRRLCHACNATPGVRDLYPPAHAPARPGGGAPDATPTDTAPGSEGRVLCYADRAERGVGIFHERDRPLDLT